MEGYIYSDECLYSADCEFSFGIFGKAFDFKVEPAFGVDSVSCFDSIIDAAESILFSSSDTLNSESCLTSCIFPDSKSQLRCIYLYLEPR